MSRLEDLSFPDAHYDGDLERRMLDISESTGERYILRSIKARLHDVGINRHLTIDLLFDYPAYTASVYNNVIAYLQYKGYRVDPFVAYGMLADGEPAVTCIRISW